MSQVLQWSSGKIHVRRAENRCECEECTGLCPRFRKERSGIDESRHSGYTDSNQTIFCGFYLNFTRISPVFYITVLI